MWSSSEAALFLGERFFKNVLFWPPFCVWAYIKHVTFGKCCMEHNMRPQSQEQCLDPVFHAELVFQLCFVPESFRKILHSSLYTEVGRILWASELCETGKSNNLEAWMGQNFSARDWRVFLFWVSQTVNKVVRTVALGERGVRGTE